ncbi:DUF3160 domain-containing protein [Brevibacillus migulae]|uniref:DUF3160 domain-containing protein n=1 Tax=Brevibacillus migulae TaxID=1644114 RepID=UPI00106E6989|nr:DUF3160 domain-containing protein [Brevibacillus migulae]
MRRLWTVVLGASLIASGCIPGKEASSDQKVPASVRTAESGEKPLPLMKLNEKWSTLEVISSSKPPFTIPAYEAKVKPYTIAPDFSNIENIHQFSGFTDQQQEMLRKNGFVVLPSRDTKMFYVYDANEYGGIPNFITADSVLHTYHQFYDKSLMSVESGYLSKDLDRLTERMLDSSVAMLQALKEDELIKLQKKNIAYFLVARMLMNPSAPIPDGIDKEIAELAGKEITLIQKAESFSPSPLFQTDLDYSQFTVRGHYTKSEELGRFFKTMMWLGTAPLPFFTDSGEFLYDNTLQALLMSMTTFLESEEPGSAELWSNLYVPTSQYVGVSDDIHVFTMNGLRVSVFGKDTNPNAFNDKAYVEKLREAVKALPEPKIQGKLTTVTTPVGKQFRYMGQRYVMDSFIMQSLMEPILRPVPSGLDVMGVLGSKTAEDLLLHTYKPQERWPDYEKNFRLLKDKVSGYPEDIWGNNLYNGWLWSIQDTLTEYDAKSGMPFFMTTEAWKRKSLNTGLGSYTELKHDTVLYGKQPVAEMGGPMEVAKQHYVEPNIPLYSKLLYLTDYTISVLKERGMASEALLTGADEYRDLLELLITCSIKELRNESLTAEENERLLWYGGTLEHISNSYLTGMAQDESALELSDMLVSDVATIAPNQASPGGNLSLGTGYFDHIYVVVPFNGKLSLARGSVYSYYEFVSDKRLTDEEWWELNGLQKVQQEYGTFLESTAPSKALPKQPSWVETFKSNINKVETKPLEVDWDQLNE